MESFWEKVRGAALPANERIWLRNAAERIANRFSDPLIVNLGVWRGASMHCLRAGAPSARLVGIDLKADDHLLGREILRAEFIRGDVEQCWRVFPFPIHMLFFDADHKVDSMRLQLDGWMPLIVVGGIAAFHDYSLAEPRFGVKRSVDEFFHAEAQGKWKFLKRCAKIKGFRRLK